MFRKILVLCLFLANTSFATPIDRIIAVVNKDMVTESELISAEKLWRYQTQKNKIQPPSREVLREKLLENIILEKIQVQIAKQHGIEIDTLTLDNFLAELAHRDGMTVDELQNNLAAENIDFQDYKKYVKINLLTENLRQQAIGHKISVSENEINDYLSSPIGQEQAGYEYNVSHILINIPSAPSSKVLQQKTIKANDVATKVKSGEDFSAIALTESDGRQAINGGNIGWRRLSELPSIFTKHLYSMKVGEIVGPIRNNNGFHIIKLVGKRNKEEQENLETKVQHILIQTDAHMSDKEAKHLLKNLRAEIVEKDNFAELAKKYSNEIVSAEKGGKLGWINKESVSPGFYRKMNLLAPGEISHPFKTEIGWHLIKVLERRDAKTSQEALKTKVHNIIFHRKFNDYAMNWLNEIRADSNIEVYT